MYHQLRRWVQVCRCSELHSFSRSHAFPSMHGLSLVKVKRAPFCWFVGVLRMQIGTLDKEIFAHDTHSTILRAKNRAGAEVVS